METKFKVGQVWKDRDGTEWKIAEVDEAFGGIMAGRGNDTKFHFSADGFFLCTETPNDWDLVELFVDVADEPAPRIAPDPEVDVGPNSSPVPPPPAPAPTIQGEAIQGVLDTTADYYGLTPADHAAEEARNDRIMRSQFADTLMLGLVRTMGANHASADDITAAFNTLHAARYAV